MIAFFYQPASQPPRVRFACANCRLQHTALLHFTRLCPAAETKLENEHLFVCSY